ncbi:uncharacterized protein EMH_0092350 [Eimeria mitis]|uniref:Uncharacterized protein n=1 Tax=Eimeria mitis TaxID=44415 RepID=U6KCR1_9EIME|nr:uncharacterized protein EMH_0092350 [Eimeria mitis]CDJ35810.1 hypothetical protein, conserved [Eimeria mitis]
METRSSDGGEELYKWTGEKCSPEMSATEPVNAHLKFTTLGAAEPASVVRAAAVAADAAAADAAATVEAAAASGGDAPNEASDAGEDFYSELGCLSATTCLFVGQEVRIHLVDLVRTRLTCIPLSYLGSMNSFFREMYTREIEQDAELAELYVHHSSSRKNTSLRPSRRIRGVITAFYTTEEQPTENVLRLDSVCGLEICFRVGVSVHLSSPSAPGGSISSSHDFAVYRRWAVRDFLSLRRVYSQNYSVDIFVEKRTAREGARRQFLNSTQFFLSLRPDLCCSQGASGEEDPFLLNGSPLPPPPAAADSQFLHPAAAAAASTPQRKRGRPRKFPRPEETAVASAQGLSLQQQQQRGSPGGDPCEGPKGTTVQTFGVKVYISYDTQGSSDTDRNLEEETAGDTVDTEQNNYTVTRSKASARLAKRRRGEETQQIPASSLPLAEAHRGPSRGPSLVAVCGRSAAEGNSKWIEVAEQQQQQQHQHQQQQQHQQQLREEHPPQEQQQQHHHEGRQEEGLLSPCGSVASGAGEFLSPSLSGFSLAPHINVEPRDTFEKMLLPYYRRCLQLLLSGLLGCLHSIPYTTEALIERQRAIGQCLLAVTSPCISLAALQTLINPFGRCIKTHAAPNDLDIHLQQDLVEDVLHLSRFLEQPAAAAAAAVAAGAAAAAAAGTVATRNASASAAERKRNTITSARGKTETVGGSRE